MLQLRLLLCQIMVMESPIYFETLMAKMQMEGLHAVRANISLTNHGLKSIDKT